MWNYFAGRVDIISKRLDYVKTQRALYVGNLVYLNVVGGYVICEFITYLDLWHIVMQGDADTW